MNTSRIVLTVALASPLAAQNWSDDFDRADSDAPGPDWTEQYGDMDVAGQNGVEGAGANSKMQHNTASIAYTDCTASIDVLPLNPGYGYVCIIMGDGGSRNLFTKLQDNDNDAQFDSIWFYSNDQATTWGVGSITVSPPVTGCRMTQYVTNGGDTMNVDLDTNFDGTVDQHYENHGILAFAGSFGTGLGIGAWSGARWDNWTAGTGETLTGTPASISVGAGGSQVLSMDVGPSEAGKTYFVLGSLTGTAPGLTYAGTNVPLNFDPYLVYTLLNPNSPPLSGSGGVLNSLGQTTAVLTIPPGSDPALVGLPLHHAGIVLELVSGAFNLPAVTNAAACQLVP